MDLFAIDYYILTTHPIKSTEIKEYLRVWAFQGKCGFYRASKL